MTSLNFFNFTLQGHLSDVDSVAIHPNSNYLATGSSDRTVRVWDILSGNSVRVYTGHKVSMICEARVTFNFNNHLS